jgi:hypothetical protein
MAESARDTASGCLMVRKPLMLYADTPTGAVGEKTTGIVS